MILCSSCSMNTPAALGPRGFRKYAEASQRNRSRQKNLWEENPFQPASFCALYILVLGFKNKHIRCLSWLDLNHVPRYLGRPEPIHEAEGGCCTYICTKLGCASVDKKQDGQNYAVISILVSCFRLFWARNAPWRLRCMHPGSPQRSFPWGTTAMIPAVRSSWRSHPRWPRLRLGFQWPPAPQGQDRYGPFNGFHFPLIWVSPCLSSHWCLALNHLCKPPVSLCALMP